MANDKRILVIAGSDSSGGAGLEADQKVIAAHGCYAMTATTALTAQNTQGVLDVFHTPSQFVTKQINACIDDIGVDVVKTGMLASTSTTKAVAEALELHGRPTSIIDPVMMSTSGAQLLPPEAVRVFREQILPLASILTPNIPEAKLLLEDAGYPIPEMRCLDDLIEIAKAVHRLKPAWVLLKGGHLPLTKERQISRGDEDRQIVIDVLVGNGVTLIETVYLKSKNTHGTGCSLASAIACNIALGYAIPDAVRKACRYVEAGIRLAIDRGQGSGPIDHFHSSYMLPFPPGGFIDYLISQADQIWQSHTNHQFIQLLADGSLPLNSFKHYLVQDYLFLVQFARSKALGSSKLKSMPGIVAGAREILHIEREMSLHLEYCKSFGLSKVDVESASPSQACTAYTRFVIDIGHSEDWFALQVAFAPCLIGYGMIARRLFDDSKTVRGSRNRYWQWIENYVADDYTETVSMGKDVLEKYAVSQSPDRVKELVEIFIATTQLETRFWDMGHREESWKEA